MASVASWNWIFVNELTDTYCNSSLQCNRTKAQDTDLQLGGRVGGWGIKACKDLEMWHINDQKYKWRASLKYNKHHTGNICPVLNVRQKDILAATNFV